MLDSMTKTIMILVIAAAFVAGSLVTGTAAFAAPGEQGKPFEFLQAQIDDIISGATAVGAVAWTSITGIPADIADGDDDTQLSEAQVETFITNGAIDLDAGTTLGGASISTGAHTVDTNTNAGTLCTAGQYLDGDDTCKAIPPSGTVISVATGTGLTGGPITTSGTISVDLNQIQSRVTGTCPSGSSIRAISPSGTVTCELDNGSFLGVSRQVATGTIPAFGSVTLSINCPSDRVVVGGGYLAIQPTSFVVSNHPATITSWRIQATNPTFVADPFTAFAMCLDNTP